MALFKRTKKQEQAACCCGCGSSCSSSAQQEKECGCSKPGDVLQIKVLGSGCKNCHALFENTKAAVAEQSLSADVLYVTDMAEIAAYGVMRMPALVIEDTVVSMGKVLRPEEVTSLLLRFIKNGVQS